MARSRGPAAVVDEQAWAKVSQAQPCRICGAVDGCLMLTSGEFADCHQAASERPLVDGGWLHRLDPATGLDSPELVAAASGHQAGTRLCG